MLDTYFSILVYRGVSLMLLSNYGSHSQITNFGGMNRRFQAKREKYLKCRIIKSTASIPTKFCTTVKTTSQYA